MKEWNSDRRGNTKSEKMAKLEKIKVKKKLEKNS